MGDSPPNVARARIARSAWEFARGEKFGPDEPGYCLKLVRMVIEHAFGWDSHEFYARYVRDTWVQPEGYPRKNGHWARDAEKALRDLGWWVAPAEAQAGDVLFNWQAAWSERWGDHIGHVAVALEHGLMLENVNPAYRKHAMSRGATCISPRTAWEPTTAVRFPSEVD